MADVFISYSRRDEELVELLREALAQQGKDVWVDREDIGPAVVWRREIELGIEGADVFAFVISPDSLRSEPCARELEHAVEKQKRIVPLLRREPEGLSVPGELASRNYVFFRTDEQFDPGVAALLAAIEGLPEWARDHTRLLQRAEEWERSDRDASFLLRGSDLSKAELWLSEQAAHSEPQPTPLQTEYLLVSRKAATRRQRITIGAALLALAVSVVLGLVALLQRNEAIRQTQLAKSRELAATSDVAVRTDPWEALALAIEAAETSSTPEATDALRRALEAPRESAVLELPGYTITTARFTADSAHVLTTSTDGRLHRWNLATEDYVSIGRQTSFGGEAPPPNDLSPDGGLRTTAAINGVRVSDASTGTRLIGLDRLGGGVEGTIRGAQFSPDGRSFLTVGYDGRAQVWPLRLTLLGENEAVAGAISKDGGRCLTADLDVTATVWSCASGEKLWSLRLPAPGVANDLRTVHADFSADGDQVVVSTGLNTTVIDAESGHELSQLRGSPDLGVSPTISPSGLLALRALADGRAEVIGLPEENQIRTLPVDLRFGRRVVFSDNDRRVVASFRQDPVVRVWGLPSDPQVPIERFEGPVEDADLSADGSILLTASGTINASASTVERWDAATGEGVGALTPPHYVFAAAFASDERFVVTGEADGTARVWETSTGRPVAAYIVDPLTPIEVALSEDGRLLAVGNEGSAFVFDCVACAQPPELLAEARAELESRPASSASPAGLQDP